MKIAKRAVFKRTVFIDTIEPLPDGQPVVWWEDKEHPEDRFYLHNLKTESEQIFQGSAHRGGIWVFVRVQ